jgi:hypothetical protein
LFRVLRHPLHLGLQLVSSDRLLPVIFQHERVVQITCDFAFQLRLRHHRIQRWLGIRAFFWPDPVTPVNVFDCPLIHDTIRKAQASPLVCICAEGGVFL